MRIIELISQCVDSGMQDVDILAVVLMYKKATRCSIRRR